MTFSKVCFSLNLPLLNLIKSNARKPVILLTANQREQEPLYAVNSHYVTAVQSAGGLPLAVCPSEAGFPDPGEYLSRADALLLTGGMDVWPRFYGQEPHAGIGMVCSSRDLCELAFARHALANGIPVLGICRGIQILNVAAGGSLHQDLVTLPRDPPLLHFQTAERGAEWHSVSVEADSRINRIMGGLIRGGVLQVNSIHHQSVDRLADGWRITAHAPDGVVEAMEMEDHPFAIGVQWHPEEMPNHLPLIEAFVRFAARAA